MTLPQNNKSDAEKVLEFIVDKGMISLCQSYVAAMKETNNPCKDQWTAEDTTNEILLAYEKTLAPKQ
jgi:hypothetical protein